jgi:7,8-dihydropterin-6-yl-methyl-4-(beta-D-ribofuranosyl)aminobenzene 5'-phosphate synthase
MDDRSIVLNTEKGLVLLCGCCHAGIINTLNYVRSISRQKIHAVIGGIHLVGAKPTRIDSTLGELQNIFQPDEMYFNHCTGRQAIVALTQTFGERVKPYVAGQELVF